MAPPVAYRPCVPDVTNVWFNNNTEYENVDRCPDTWKLQLHTQWRRLKHRRTVPEWRVAAPSEWNSIKLIIRLLLYCCCKLLPTTVILPWLVIHHSRKQHRNDRQWTPSLSVHRNKLCTWRHYMPQPPASWQYLRIYSPGGTCSSMLAIYDISNKLTFDLLTL